MTFELSNILLSLGTSSIVIVLKEKHSLVNYKATNYNNARIFSLLNNSFQSRMHCVKSVQIRSFFWSVFSLIRTEYGEILRIQSECRKIWTRKNSVFGHFHAVMNFAIRVIYIYFSQQNILKLM